MSHKHSSCACNPSYLLLLRLLGKSRPDIFAVSLGRKGHDRRLHLDVWCHVVYGRIFVGMPDLVEGRVLMRKLMRCEGAMVLLLEREWIGILKLMRVKNVRV